MNARTARGVAASCLLLSVSAGAQEAALTDRYLDPSGGLTLSQAIAEGLRREPNLRAARLEIEAARGERRQAALRPNPSVSAERREEIGGTDNQTTIGLDLPLDLFRRRARVAVADTAVVVTERAVEDRERLVAADVREKVGHVLAAVRRLAVLNDLAESSRRTVALLESRVREGAAPPLDRDVASVDLQRLLAGRELAIGRADAAITNLKPLLGLSAQTPLRLHDTLDAVVTADGAVVETAADSGARSDVREAQARVEEAAARVALVRQEAKPDVGFFASYMRMDSGFPQSAFGAAGALEPVHGIFNNVAGGLRIVVPVFNRNQGTRAAATARREGAERGLEARRLAADSEITAARARDAAAKRALAVYSAETRTLARHNLDVVRETYQLGRATLFDVLNEQRRYLDFESGYIDALEEAFSARTALQRATGEVR